ncbi:MAG: hypothetical protein DSZ35_00530 [Verrucomicrobia bacterium]|nr:MAG: hypothetical protein DSZ35_00530 [Verrucomicrobiota bacterium]
MLQAVAMLKSKSHLRITGSNAALFGYTSILDLISISEQTVPAKLGQHGPPRQVRAVMSRMEDSFFMAEPE